ncbi:MAG: xylulokinase [Halioglobus sp.]|nr:xylulokinase [Halioglobus sp.]
MFLGIDVGTQSVKALLYDSDRRCVADIRSAPLRLISASDGTREQRAAWWLTALDQCLAELKTADKANIQAVAVSGQQHGFVPVSSNGEVLAPVKLWCDTSTAAECEQITRRFGGQERCINELGNAILPGYTAPKILWLKNHMPDAYAKLSTILLPHDYINFYLTGKRAMECGDASGTGMLDIRQRKWHEGMLAAVDPDRDLRAVLPNLVAADASIGHLGAQVAATLGLPAGIPVASGGGDNMMSAIGTGNVSPGRLTVSLGTSGTLFTSTDKPIIDAQGVVAGFCSSTGGWLPLFCTMNCTVSTELTRKLFTMDVTELEQRVASTSVGSRGVMTVPFFNGERTPNLPNAKGCIFGLDESNYTPENMLRSAMESSIYGLRSGLDALRQLGCHIDTLRLTGGGAGSDVWRQMVADIFDLPVSVQTSDEGAALGAALQALWMFQRLQGQNIPLQALLDEHLTLDPMRACVPNKDSVREYKLFYVEYLRQIETIKTLYV